ncbi:MAG: oxygenase MpaB family protein [Chloroflexi bacterium]|nr:oxygenase MpaB family protein [Chloroflexota bacterium]
MFHHNSRLVLGAYGGGVLVEGFSTNIGRSFNITGRLRDQGVRRLQQNNRHMIEIFMPYGLAIDGDGWRLSVRVRLVHAQVRRLLSNSDDWDTEAWGVPLSSAHMGNSITAFSARLLQHMKSLGAVFNEDEARSFLTVWRYTGHLMGIPEEIFFEQEEDALELYALGMMCEPPDWDSIIMANGLVNSAPLVIGITKPAERRQLAKYVYSGSRAMIGNRLADEMRYPKSPTFGVLPWFRLQSRYYRFVEEHLPKLSRVNNFTNFTGLLEAAAFDEAGISYRLSDHPHAEESRPY